MYMSSIGVDSQGSSAIRNMIQHQQEAARQGIHQTQAKAARAAQKSAQVIRAVMSNSVTAPGVGSAFNVVV